MIKFIEVEALLPLRNTILREGKLSPDECRFPTDLVEGAFHLGYYEGETLACIASFSPQSCSNFSGLGYQLRGMATAAAYQGKGLGTRLVNFAIVHLQAQKANYIWCNARKKALKFYGYIGFEIISEEFEVAGIGPHRVMYLKIG